MVRAARLSDRCQADTERYGSITRASTAGHLCTLSEAAGASRDVAQYCRCMQDCGVGVGNIGRSRSRSRCNFTDSDSGSHVLVTALVTYLACRFLVAPVPMTENSSDDFCLIFTSLPIRHLIFKGKHHLKGIIRFFFLQNVGVIQWKM